MINGVLAQVHLIVDPVGPQRHSGVILSILKCKVAINTVSSWQNPYMASLWSESYYGGKCYVEFIRAVYVWLIGYPKQHHSPGGISEISVKSLKDVEVTLLTTTPFSSPT